MLKLSKNAVLMALSAIYGHKVAIDKENFVNLPNNSNYCND